MCAGNELGKYQDGVLALGSGILKGVGKWDGVGAGIGAGTGTGAGVGVGMVAGTGAGVGVGAIEVAGTGAGAVPGAVPVAGAGVPHVTFRCGAGVVWCSFANTALNALALFQSGWYLFCMRLVG
jgi:hypothetical protein